MEDREGIRYLEEADPVPHILILLVTAVVIRDIIVWLQNRDTLHQIVEVVEVLFQFLVV